MCGRFSLTAQQDVLEKYFGVQIDEFRPRYNIAPSQNIPIIVMESPKVFSEGKWGLIPKWAKDEKIGNSLINARSDSVQEKPSFRDSFKGMRCLIPADGFFEWKSVGNSKIPFRIARKDREVFAFAGLYAKWNNAEGREVLSCTIITTEPNAVVSKIHTRMPAMLLREQHDVWMDKDASPKELFEVIQSYPDALLEAYPVSTLVNSPSNTGPEVIVPLRTLV